jgi:MucR family transcriptional regulator, transcriptional regulator of exopolysaccharide biosynthesis
VDRIVPEKTGVSSSSSFAYQERSSFLRLIMGPKMEINDTPVKSSEMLMELTADVVAAYVSNNPVPAAELPNLIADIHAALGRVGGSPEPMPVEKQKPAVNPKRSVHDEYIVCLEDGKKFKSLKRHLMTHYNMTPDQYRDKWGLDPSYPMVAPHYAAARSQLAKKMGLGRKRKGR